MFRKSAIIFFRQWELLTFDSLQRPWHSKTSAERFCRTLQNTKQLKTAETVDKTAYCFVLHQEKETVVIAFLLLKITSYECSLRNCINKISLGILQQN